MPLLDLPGNVDLLIEIPLSMFDSLASHPLPKKSGKLFLFFLLLIFVLKIVLISSTELLDYWLIELDDSDMQYFV